MPVPSSGLLPGSGCFMPGSVPGSGLLPGSGCFMPGASSGYNQTRYYDRHMLSGPLSNSGSRDSTGAREASAGR